MAYNGYTNYPTWVTRLWIDEYFPNYFNERYKEIKEDEDPNPTYTLAQEIQANIEDIVNISEPTLQSDLMSYSVGLINWYEIAETFEEEKDNE